MIRRDYILRMIEEFVAALTRISSLKQGQQWTEAARNLEAEFKRLIGDGSKVESLSETELLARLMHDGPTHLLRDKTLMLVTLLKEAGDVAAAENRLDASRECYLKALHLLLDVLARGEVFECPEFVPKIEMLVTVLQPVRLPARTQAMLMQHYERTGEFAKAEDALFAVLEASPHDDALVKSGMAFYQRLLAQSDAALSAACLPRAEVEEGLKELQRRQK